MKKDIVRLDDFETDNYDEMEENSDKPLTVDEIFELADSDLKKLDAISEKLKNESKQEKKHLNFLQKELRAFVLFVFILMCFILVSIVYLIRNSWPLISEEWKKGVKTSQDELQEINNDELSFDLYFIKQIIMGLDAESIQNSIDSMEKLSEFSDLMTKMEEDPESADLSELDEEQQKEFYEFYEKYQKEQQKEKLKEQLAKQLKEQIKEAE